MEQSKNTVQTSCCRVDKKATKEKNCDDCKTKDAEINKLGKQIRELIEKMKHENQSKASLQRDLDCLGLLYNQLEEKYGHLGHIQREYWEAKFENRDEFVKKWEELDKFVHDTWEKDHEEHRYMHQVKCESDDVAAKNETLKAHNIDLIQTNAHFRKEHERKNSEIDRLTKELNYTTSELKNLSERNFHLKKEWKEMQESVQGVNEMSFEHDRILRIKHEAIENLEEENKTMKTKLTEINKQIDSLTTDLQKQRDEYQDLTGINNQLEDDLKAIKMELKRSRVISRENTYKSKSKQNEVTVQKLDDDRKVMGTPFSKMKIELGQTKVENQGEKRKVNFSTKDVTKEKTSSREAVLVRNGKKIADSSNTDQQANEETKPKTITKADPNVKLAEDDVSRDFCYSDGYQTYIKSDAYISHMKTTARRTLDESDEAKAYYSSDAYNAYMRTGDLCGLKKTTAFKIFVNSNTFQVYIQSNARKSFSSSLAYRTFKTFRAIRMKKLSKDHECKGPPNCDFDKCVESGESLVKFQRDEYLAVSNKEPMKEKKQEQQLNRNGNADCSEKKYQTEKDLATSDDADTLTIDSGVVSDAFSI